MPEELFVSLGHSAVGQFLAGSTVAFATTEALHIVALALLGGVVLVSNLATLRVVLKAMSPGDLVLQLQGLFYASLLLAGVTGVMLVAAGPYKYYTNPLFPLKLGVLVLAVVVHIVLQRRLRPAKAADRTSRVLASSSLLLWSGVVVAGRWLGLI